MKMHIAETTERIGFAVTTRNRRDQLAVTLDKIIEHGPRRFKLVVVDDASDGPAIEDDRLDEVYRFDHNVGVARAKNKCLELLADCDHLFLFDDDAYPIVDGWWRPYVESPEPHLMRQFLDLAGPRKLGDVTELYRDSHHVALSGPRGVMLYVERHVLDVVGGLDPVYSPWGYEHGDWSNRIHHAGLTTWRYADVVDSDQLVYSMDEHEAVDRSVDPGDRARHVRRNAAIHNRRRDEGYQAFVPYIEPSTRNVVITQLYNGKPDPQRPDAVPLDWHAMDELMASIPPTQELIVITDLPRAEGDASTVPRAGEVVHHELATNVYFERWIAAYQWLRANPDVGYACIVDATDVVMQFAPWGRMDTGRLYIGHEPSLVGHRWMRRNHPAVILQRFITNNPTKTLLNPGVIGGDRDTVMAFIHKLIEVYFDIQTRVFTKRDRDAGIGDMGVVNYVAYTHFGDTIEFGPWWVTPFKSYETNDIAAWRHK